MAGPLDGVPITQVRPLTDEQLSFFKTNGYLIVPGAMDPQRCAIVRDLMWADVPADFPLQRDDPTTHVGPFADAYASDDSVHVMQGHRWLNRALGTSKDVVELVYSDSICAMAVQLTGGTLRQATVDGTPMGSHGPAWPGGPTDPALGTDAARGTYCTLPYGDIEREPASCHTDGHPFQLGIVGLIGDCPPDGGAFTVWPGSHARLYPTFTLRYDQPRIPYYEHLPSFRGIVHTAEYLAEIDRLNHDTVPVECHGQAGDVVLWHHRLAHMAGHNHSDTIRQAVLADFWTADLDHFRTQAPDGDMWRDWSDDLQAISEGEYSVGFAASQGLRAEGR